MFHTQPISFSFLIFHVCSHLFTQGYPNCPSGFDESSSLCGATRKLLELPAGLYAAFGCLTAGIIACLIFCMVGIARRKKDDTVEQPKYPQSQTTTLNGSYTMPKSLNGSVLYGGTLASNATSGSAGDTLKKNSVYYNNLDYDSWHTLHPPVDYVDYVHVDRETTVWPAVVAPENVHQYETFYYQNELIDYDANSAIYNNQQRQVQQMNQQQQQPNSFNKLHYLVTILNILLCFF